MPYQSAPPLVIITLAFGAVGGLIKLNNYLFLGRSDRKLRVDPFDIRMQERDVIIDWRKQEVAKLRDQKTSYTPEELNAKIMTGPIRKIEGGDEEIRHSKPLAGILRTHFFQKP